MNFRSCPYNDPTCSFGTCARCLAFQERVNGALPPFLDDRAEPSASCLDLATARREEANAQQLAREVATIHRNLKGRPELAHLDDQPPAPWKYQAMGGALILSAGLFLLLPPRSPGGLACGTMLLIGGVINLYLGFRKPVQPREPAPVKNPPAFAMLCVPAQDQASIGVLETSLQVFVESGERFVLVDLVECDPLSSALVGMLMRKQEAIKDRCQLLLLGVSARDFRVLSRCGMTRLLRVVDTIDEARAIALRTEEACLVK